MFGNSSDFKRKTLKRGEILLKEGDKLSEIYVLVSGKILNFSIKNSRVIPLYLSDNSGVIGEDCALTQDRICHYNSISLSDSILLEIPRREVVQFVNESSTWIKDLIFNISQKSINTSKLILEHQIKDDALFGDSIFGGEDEKFILESFKAAK